ncbi:MAG: P1 family peptidase [Pseudomonadota bacterium]
MITGSTNLITDVTGIRVGNAEDMARLSGVTVIMTERPARAAVDVRGGAPGTRETDLLDPERSVAGVDAITLSGGSAFGLDAAAGVQALLAEMGRGFEIGGIRVPIAPAAILFDLLNGGVHGDARYPPYRDMGYAAAASVGTSFALGSAGAGLGATTATVRGGLGSASEVLPTGVTVGAIVAVNAVGTATVGDSAHFWAAPFEIGAEFGGLDPPDRMPERAAEIVLKGRPDPSVGQNTTIGVIATDASLTGAEARRLAVAGQDGLSRALWPCHTALDGDTVFALATGVYDAPDGLSARMDLETAAARVMARAVARGVFHAASSAGLVKMPPAWSDRFGVRG